MPDLPPEAPFTPEERYQLRRLVKLLSDIDEEDLKEVKTLARSGRFARTFGLIMGRIFIWISGLVGIAVAFKQFYKDGGT